MTYYLQPGGGAGAGVQPCATAGTSARQAVPQGVCQAAVPGSYLHVSIIIYTYSYLLSTYLFIPSAVAAEFRGAE